MDMVIFYKNIILDIIELTNAIYCASVNTKPYVEPDYSSKLKHYKPQRAITKSLSKIMETSTT